MSSRLRTLFPHELELFEQHLLRLDAEDRFLRFGARLNDAAIKAYIKRFSMFDSLNVAYLEDGVVRAAAHLAFSSGFPAGAGEVGLSVEPDWRLKGIGYALTLRAAMLAANRGVDQIQVFCMPDNKAMQAIARKLDGNILREGDLLEGAIRVLPATPFTYLREGIDQSEGVFEAFFQRA